MTHEASSQKNGQPEHRYYKSKPRDGQPIGYFFVHLKAVELDMGFPEVYAYQKLGYDPNWGAMPIGLIFIIRVARFQIHFEEATIYEVEEALIPK